MAARDPLAGRHRRNDALHSSGEPCAFSISGSRCYCEEAAIRPLPARAISSVAGGIKPSAGRAAIGLRITQSAEQPDLYAAALETHAETSGLVPRVDVRRDLARSTSARRRGKPRYRRSASACRMPSGQRCRASHVESESMWAALCGGRGLGAPSGSSKGLPAAGVRNAGLRSAPPHPIATCLPIASTGRSPTAKLRRILTREALSR